MDRRISQDRRPFPRTKQEWRERVREAMHFGERVSPPLPGGRALVLRVGLLGAVALLTGLLVALASSPAVGIIGKTVNTIADRFTEPIGNVDVPAIAERSVVLDREGREIEVLRGEYCRDANGKVTTERTGATCETFENRVFVPLAKIPVTVRRAVLAIEDAKFYEHQGVDLRGLVRALLSNFRAGSVRQGGSTITQQLVKNTLVGNERSLDRKIKEARMAVRLEKERSKDEILELYLNEAYFGNGVYGIGTAAEFYFGKQVAQLRVQEAALLAGIVKAPEDYEPLGNAKAAKARRNLVLQRMAEERFISAQTARTLSRRALGASEYKLQLSPTPYLVDHIKAQILADDRFGATPAERERALLQAGLRIHTTFDLDLQREAVKAARDILDLRNDPSAAAVLIDAKTGAVRAMVSHNLSKRKSFNLATQGKRQPGSTFKPVAMLAALEAGISPTLSLDTPSPLETGVVSDGKPWRPTNYSGKGEGVMDMRRATELSVNSYYVQLMLKVGPEKVVDAAKRLGITSELGAIPSLVLGTEVVSPLELTNAYATLANNGTRCTAFTITKVTDAAGATLLENEPDCEQTVDPKIAALATDILRGVPERGTGRTNGRIGRPVAGKTGTTDNYVDALYAGYTPQYASVVWLGFPDDNTRELKNIHGLPKVFGGSLPAMIWNRVMRAAHRGVRVEQFPAPGSIAAVTIPAVRNKTVEEATTLLEELGFTVQTEAVRSHRARGIVLGSDPAEGTEVSKGSVVTLRVSDGQGTKPSPSRSPSPSPSPSHSPSPSPSPSASPSESPSPAKG